MALARVQALANPGRMMGDIPASSDDDDKIVRRIFQRKRKRIGNSRPRVWRNQDSDGEGLPDDELPESPTSTVKKTRVAFHGKLTGESLQIVDPAHQAEDPPQTADPAAQAEHNPIEMAQLAEYEAMEEAEISAHQSSAERQELERYGPPNLVSSPKNPQKTSLQVREVSVKFIVIKEYDYFYH